MADKKVIGVTHVLVGAGELDLYKTAIPLDEDKSLDINDVLIQYPHTTGLKYKLKVDTYYTQIKLKDGKFICPLEGWPVDGVYVIRMSVDTSDIAEIRQRMLTKDEAMEKLLTKDDAEGEFVTLAQFKEFKDDMKGIRTYKLELMKMSIILLLFFAFLMIFNTNSETRLEKFEKMYAKLPNPIPIYLNIFPCPNCEEWCANHPKYTCNYSCGPPYYDFYGVKDINIHRPFIGENVVKELKGEMENFVHDALVKRFLNVSKVVIKNTYVSKEVKQIKEFCANLTNKNFTCKFHNNKYPICSSDFKAYDSEMEGFCKLVKDCYAKIKNEPINLKECTDITDSFYIIKLKIDRDNINSNYSWTIDNSDEEMLTKYFGIQCINGRLLHNNSLPISTTTKLTTKNLKTFKMTKTSTKKKVSNFKSSTIPTLNTKGK